jgi:hypothetical protein
VLASEEEDSKHLAWPCQAHLNSNTTQINLQMNGCKTADIIKDWWATLEDPM